MVQKIVCLGEEKMNSKPVLEKLFILTIGCLLLWHFRIIGIGIFSFIIWVRTRNSKKPVTYLSQKSNKQAIFAIILTPVAAFICLTFLHVNLLANISVFIAESASWPSVLDNAVLLIADPTFENVTGKHKGSKTLGALRQALHHAIENPMRPYAANISFLLGGLVFILFNTIHLNKGWIVNAPSSAMKENARLERPINLWLLICLIVLCLSAVVNANGAFRLIGALDSSMQRPLARPFLNLLGILAVLWFAVRPIKLKHSTG